MRLKVPSLIFGVILAFSVSGAAFASLSQGFAVTSAIPAGSLVSLDAKSSGTVVVGDTTNADRLFGIAVSPSSASISLGATNGTGQVQVTTTGSANAFVSTANGTIKVGDPITVSSIAGVGQKATGKVRVIGTAQVDFDGKGDGVTKTTVDIGGSKKEVAVGQIPVQIAVTTLNQDSSQTYVVPTWLQSLSNSLAGKAVTPLRLLIAGIILITGVICVTVLLYSAVRNSIISIGRNPLSKTAVYKGLFQVVVVSIVIMAIAAGAMYVVISR